MKKLKMPDNSSKGLLITFCGLDGSGKTTLINKLAEEIKNYTPVCLTKQPSDNVRNSDIFRTFMDSEDHDVYDYRSMSIFAASDRVQHVSKVIFPKLKNGCTVISDRYYYSCLANLRARGYSDDKWIYEIAKYIIKPDISFFIDVPADVAISRVRSRETEKNRYIDVDLQYKLRNEYLNICKVNRGVLVSSECSVEESYSIIEKEVKRKLQNG